jgi:hypothetical protein
LLFHRVSRVSVCPDAVQIQMCEYHFEVRDASVHARSQPLRMLIVSCCHSSCLSCVLTELAHLAHRCSLLARCHLEFDVLIVAIVGCVQLWKLYFGLVSRLANYACMRMCVSAVFTQVALADSNLRLHMAPRAKKVPKPPANEVTMANKKRMAALLAPKSTGQAIQKNKNIRTR